MGLGWDELEGRKIQAFQDEQIQYALFWQNEQIMKKLNDLRWQLKEISEKNNGL